MGVSSTASPPGRPVSGRRVSPESRPERRESLKAPNPLCLFIAALALVATVGLVRPAGATGGTGTWMITGSSGGACYQSTTQAGGGYLVQPGGTYAVTLTNVTECGTRPPTTLYIQFQSSTGGNVPPAGPAAVSRTGSGPYYYSFTFTVPGPTNAFCNTGVLAYRCTAGGSNIIAVGHFFAAAF